MEDRQKIDWRKRILILVLVVIAFFFAIQPLQSNRAHLISARTEQMVSFEEVNIRLLPTSPPKEKKQSKDSSPGILKSQNKARPNKSVRFSNIVTHRLYQDQKFVRWQRSAYFPAMLPYVEEKCKQLVTVLIDRILFPHLDDYEQIRQRFKQVTESKFQAEVKKEIYNRHIAPKIESLNKQCIEIISTSRQQLLKVSSHMDLKISRGSVEKIGQAILPFIFVNNVDRSYDKMFQRLLILFDGSLPVYHVQPYNQSQWDWGQYFNYIEPQQIGALASENEIEWQTIIQHKQNIYKQKQLELKRLTQNLKDKNTFNKESEEEAETTTTARVQGEIMTPQKQSFVQNQASKLFEEQNKIFVQQSNIAVIKKKQQKLNVYPLNKPTQQFIQSLIQQSLFSMLGIQHRLNSKKSETKDKVKIEKELRLKQLQDKIKAKQQSLQRIQRERKVKEEEQKKESQKKRDEGQEPPQDQARPKPPQDQYKLTLSQEKLQQIQLLRGDDEERQYPMPSGEDDESKEILYPLP